MALNRENRVTTPNDFRLIRRKSSRAATSNLVAHVKVTDGTTRFGFVVPNTVGNAVVRNTVKRRMREVAAEFIKVNPEGFDVVINALPPAANASFEVLRADITRALSRARRR